MMLPNTTKMTSAEFITAYNQYVDNINIIIEDLRDLVLTKIDEEEEDLFIQLERENG